MRAAMQCGDFSYDLPEALIAQAPPDRRGDARLLCLDGATGGLSDRSFRDLPALLRAGDLLVLNDTRVIPARLFGRKRSGGQVELLLERILDERRILAQLRASKRTPPGRRIELDGGAVATVSARHGALFELELDCPALALFEAHGHVPLPPYITRPAGAGDRERYQTVYAQAPGAVAAPTAGLHFDEAMLARLARDGIEHTFVTLHVGAGTFQPLRVDDVREHEMHAELARVDVGVVAAVARARARGGRVIAVGTTAVRSLETAAQGGSLAPFEGDTRLFIYPGFRFQATDAIITNFHLPESTLLMLVCAFAGTAHTLAAYHHAVSERYRFFSYGDAMFVTPSDRARPGRQP